MTDRLSNNQLAWPAGDRPQALQAGVKIREEASKKSAEIEAEQRLVQERMLAERERLEEESRKMDAALVSQKRRETVLPQRLRP